MEQQLLQEIRELKTLILDLHSTSKSVYDFEQARKYLGSSSSYLYKLTSNNEIPHYKPQGKKIYFDKLELDQWLKTNRHSTHKELDQKATEFCEQNSRGL